MVRRLGLGKNNHLTYASLALNPRFIMLFSPGSLLVLLVCSVIVALPGPSCSKLMMLLVNIVKTLIIKYGIYTNIFAEKILVA